MKRIHTALALALGIAAAGPALAWHDDYYSHDNRAGVDYARVVDVEPVTERSREPVDREVCYDQPVDRYEPRYTSRHDSTGGAILGALIGGALGNTVGHGDGRKAATIAGAVVGGSVGHNYARNNDTEYDAGGSYERDYETRCRNQTDWQSSNEVVAYNVTYRYDGRTYHTTLDHDPGERIRVNVDAHVTPAE